MSVFIHIQRALLAFKCHMEEQNKLTEFVRLVLPTQDTKCVARQYTSRLSHSLS